MAEVPAGVSVRRGEPLARHSPWRVGGPCDAFVVVHRRDAVPDALAWCRDEGLQRTVLGAGTRTVFRDGGLAGAILRLGSGFQQLATLDDGWWIGGAVPLAVLSTLGEHPLVRGLRHAPGTFGASIAQDPGWEPWIDVVRAIHRGGERELTVEELKARASGAIIVEARFRARPSADLPKKATLGPAAPTSWYVPDPAVDLTKELRIASLHDVRLRASRIAPAAPELLVNLGGATAKELHLLQRSVIDRLHKERGVQLEDRMRWEGRPK